METNMKKDGRDMKRPVQHMPGHRPPHHRRFTVPVHDCRHNGMPVNYECVVKLMYAELEYDVRYTLWKRAQMNGVQGEATQLYEITDDDSDWLLRQFQTAAYNLRRKLSWALRRDNAGRMSSDELLEAPAEWNFHFVLDRGWGGSPDNLMNAMHAYVVNFAVAEWYKMSDMNMAAVYMDIADNYLRAAYYEMDNCSIEPPVFRL